MLSNIQELVERSFYEAIRLVLVDEGYLVDEVPLIGNPNARSLYEAGMKDIATTKGFCIELFGAASNQARGEKRVPRIVIESERISPGILGAVPSGQTMVNPANPFTQVKVTSTQRSSNINLAIHLVSNKIAQDRVLHGVLIRALGLNGYIPLYDNSPEKFFINQLNYYDIEEPDLGLIEKIYEYECPDTFLDEITDPTVIAPISVIQVQIYIPEGEITNDPNLEDSSTYEGRIQNNNHLTTFE